MSFFYRAILCICITLVSSITFAMENAPPYHPQETPYVEVDSGPSVGFSIEWSSDLASETPLSVPALNFDHHTGTVSFPGDIPSISLHDNPCGPGPGGGRPQSRDPKYMYRAIDLDDSGSKALLTDQEMQEIHTLYLEGTDGSIQRIELKRDILHRKLHHHHHSVVGDYARYVDLSRPANLRRLSFMNRVVRHNQQQKEANRPPAPGTIQAAPRPGQAPREFSDNVALLRPASNIAKAIERARLLPLSPHAPEVVRDFDRLDTPQSDSALSREFRRNVTADPKTDFSEYVQQCNAMLDVLEAQGAITWMDLPHLAKVFAEGAAENAIHIGIDPVGYVKDTAQGYVEVVKQSALFFMDVYDQPEELWVSEAQEALLEERAVERMTAITQLCSQIQGTVSQMSRDDFVRLCGRMAVDYYVYKGIDLGISKIRSIKLPAKVAENSLFMRMQEQLESLGARHPELVTPEGFVFKVPQTVEETTVLKNAADNAFGGGAQAVIKVDNISTFFEKTEFGKSLQGKAQKVRGRQVYKMTQDSPCGRLAKGDHFYLDLKHRDHIEVYNKRGKSVTVLNLDGTVNKAKEVVALEQGRRIDI